VAKSPSWFHLPLIFLFLSENPSLSQTVLQVNESPAITLIIITVILVVLQDLSIRYGRFHGVQSHQCTLMRNMREHMMKINEEMRTEFRKTIIFEMLRWDIGQILPEFFIPFHN
jgi:hypothetical protein